MPKCEVTSDGLRKPPGVISQATIIEASGRLKAAVETGGGTMNDICRVDVYVRNIEQFEAIHKVRREYFKAPLPASTMVEVTKMVSPDYLIEISAIADIP